MEVWSHPYPQTQYTNLGPDAPLRIYGDIFHLALNVNFYYRKTTHYMLFWQIVPGARLHDIFAVQMILIPTFSHLLDNTTRQS